jgi:hypothetical protein
VLPAALVDGREAPLFELHAAIANVAAIGNARFMKWFTRDLSVLAHIYWEGDPVLLTAQEGALP